MSPLMFLLFLYRNSFSRIYNFFSSGLLRPPLILPSQTNLYPYINAYPSVYLLV